MTRRPIPFSGSAFFFGLAPAPGGRVALGDDATPPGKARPLRQRAGQKPPREAASGAGKHPEQRPPRSGPTHRERTPVPRSEIATGSSSASAPLKAAPFSAPVLPGAPPRAGARRCTPHGLTRIQRTFEPTGAAVLFASDSLLAPVPKVALSPSSFRTPPQPFSPHPAPRRARVHARGQKKPRGSGAKHEEGKSKGRLGEGSA